MFAIFIGSVIDSSFKEIESSYHITLFTFLLSVESIFLYFLYITCMSFFSVMSFYTLIDPLTKTNFLIQINIYFYLTVILTNI